LLVFIEEFPLGHTGSRGPSMLMTYLRKRAETAEAFELASIAGFRPLP
jgi:hypothetical protein